MKSIFSTFKVNDAKTGKPIDLIGTMQIAFDKASLSKKTMWEEMYVDKWFEYRPAQLGLTAEGIMGKYHVRIRASIIGNNADTPLRPGRGFELWSGKIPRMGHKFMTDADTLRTLLQVYENNRINPAQKLNEIKKCMFGDYKDAYLGCKDVVDEIILKALSNGGVAIFDPAIDNPDGIEYMVEYDMPAENKKLVKAGEEWTEANINNTSIDVASLLQKIVYDYLQKGVVFDKILMAPDIKYWMMRSVGLRTGYLGKDKNTRSLTEDEFSAYLKSMKIPTIEEINRRTAYQKDGKPTNINPWNDNVISFIPKTEDGKLGEVQPAFEDNAILPDPNVQYTDAGEGIRIAKWTTGESTGDQAAEWTQGTWRAVPIISCINGVVNLQVRNLDKPFAEDATTVNYNPVSEIPSV